VESLIQKARVLVEALPYISSFRNRTIVVKVGGNAMDDAAARERFAEDVILLHWVGIRVVVVHGGGPQIGEMLGKLGIESKFSGGLRVTDDQTMDVVEMVLYLVNGELVRLIQHKGGRAVGLSGKDGGLARARRLGPELGRVGEVEHVDTRILQTMGTEFIPVIAPIAVDETDATLNVNADPFAACVAAALGAEKLVLLTDVTGVKDDQGALIPTLDARRARELVDAGTIKGGMIPKVEYALNALADGVKKVHVIDGRLEHALLLEIFTDKGVGTEIVA
jgi:acetylglutamate kinase